MLVGFEIVKIDDDSTNRWTIELAQLDMNGELWLIFLRNHLK